MRVQSGCRLWVDWCAVCLPFCVSTCAGLQAFEASGPAGVLAVVCSLLSSALLLFPWCVVLEYAPISRFKGVFRWFYGVCVGLCCLGALRGLCSFCVREWLGGLETCSVFAFLFAFLTCFYLFSCFPCLPLVLSFLLCLC